MIIPAYNEEGLLAQTLEFTAAYLDRRGYDYEILVLNDGSSDSTARVASDIARRNSKIRLIDRKLNIGKGGTIKEGIEQVKYDHCLFMDADNSVSIEEWPAFEERFNRGYKAVIASRHLPGSIIVRPQPLARRLLGAGYRVLCRALLGLNASDFNCGFKAYQTTTAKQIYSQTLMKDWTFDVEVFCLLKKRGVAFAQVPVRWTHHQKKSDSVIQGPLAAAWKSLGSLLELKRRSF